ncbi:MAG: hypothetical protein WA571_13465 [Candidatus Binatus sp.]
MNQQTRQRLIWIDVIALIILGLFLLVKILQLAKVPEWLNTLIPIAGAGVIANSLWQRIRQRDSN